MLSKTIAEALNKQMNNEFFNARIYLSMATYFYSINFDGAAHWMEKQAEEETEHAMRLYEYLNEHGERIIIESLPAPPTEWASPLAAYEDAYKHECEITAVFNQLTELAQKEKDYATQIALQWFVTEQVEEEASMDSVVQKFKMAGNSRGALMMIDRKLAER
jgi:ferritin